MTMPIARVTLEERQQIIVATLSGEVDVTNARDLYHRLAENVTTEMLGLVVDLSEVAYLDSAGLGLLFELKRQLRRHERELRIAVPEGAPIRRVLQIVNINAHVPLHATVTDAVDAIRGTGRGAMQHGTIR